MCFWCDLICVFDVIYFVFLMWFILCFWFDLFCVFVVLQLVNLILQCFFARCQLIATLAENALKIPIFLNKFRLTSRHFFTTFSYKMFCVFSFLRQKGRTAIHIHRENAARLPKCMYRSLLPFIKVLWRIQPPPRTD